jgi:hypothetical protein
MGEGNCIAEMLKALSNETRFAVFMLISNHPGWRHNDVAAESDHPGVCWHHLQALTKAGILRREGEAGDDVRYYVNNEHIKNLATWLWELTQ